MTPEAVAALVPAFSGFHQDFALVGSTEREVFEWHARGISPAEREILYSALDCLLAENRSEEEFVAACWKSGADHAPQRAEVESFVSWARSPEGSAEIDGPGPTSAYVVVQAKL